MKSSEAQERWWKSNLVRAAIVIISGAVVFGIMQPFVWKCVHGQYPPAGTIDLSTLLTIVLALLALGVAAFGGGLYYILNRRLQEDARKAAEKEYRMVIVRLLTHTSSLYGRMFEILHRLRSIPDCYLISLRKSAVRWGKEANEYAEKLDEETHGRLIVGARNNYTMALALQGDKPIAEEEGIDKIIHYLEQELPKYPLRTKAIFKETIGFARWRLPRSQEDIKQASESLQQLLQDPNIDQPMKERWRERWKDFQKGTP